MSDGRAYLLHIRDSLHHILEYTSNGRDAFLADTKTQDAVIRNLEIIGEAVKNIPDVHRDLHRMFHGSALRACAIC